MSFKFSLRCLFYFVFYMLRLMSFINCLLMVDVAN